MLQLVLPGGTYRTRFSAGTTGLVGTVRIRLLQGTTEITAATTTGIVEYPAGSGSYEATPTAPDTPGIYYPAWDTGTVTPTTFATDDPIIVTPFADTNGTLDLTNLDTAISSRLAAGSAATYTGPVATSGIVTLIQGDDYNDSDDRALTWTTQNTSDWPTLTSADVAFTIRDRYNNALLTKPATVTTPAGANKSAQVELTAEETAQLPTAARLEYMLRATLNSGRTVTLTNGRAIVLDPA